MSDTSQKRLMELGAKHAVTNATVRSVYSSIRTLVLEYQSLRVCTFSALDIADKAVAFTDDDYRVIIDNSDLVVRAARLSSKLDQISQQLLVLAMVLQLAGEDISY